MAKTPAEKASEMSVSECFDRFLEAQTDTELRPATVRNYKGFFKNYVLPVCGEMPLASVEQTALQSVIRNMINVPLAPNTIQSRAGYMKGLFTWAVKQKYLLASPAEGLGCAEGFR